MPYPQSSPDRAQDSNFRAKKTDSRLYPNALQLKLAIIVFVTFVTILNPGNSTEIALISMISNCAVEIVDYYSDKQSNDKK
ncbi:MULTISPECIES: hypothetical protein [Calothrix]|uniref:Uncharacterized protein n=2 Tax=Calothrix TaxID=1186 RepID=A0ABR8ACE8_9CYAN|nr:MULTISPECIES: hypothetical protein [Calothrix]MBD2197626.1 hypothetical protein [Calothrix parietina FACHB-288]MBD2227418.1 hypothetical protein [Calothrix anomala FACHB-343]